MESNTSWKCRNQQTRPARLSMVHCARGQLEHTQAGLWKKAVLAPEYCAAHLYSAQPPKIHNPRAQNAHHHFQIQNSSNANRIRPKSRAYMLYLYTRGACAAARPSYPKTNQAPSAWLASLTDSKQDHGTKKRRLHLVPNGGAVYQNQITPSRARGLRSPPALLRSALPGRAFRQCPMWGTLECWRPCTCRLGCPPRGWNCHRIIHQTDTAVRTHTNREGWLFLVAFGLCGSRWIALAVGERKCCVVLHLN